MTRGKELCWMSKVKKTSGSIDHFLLECRLAVTTNSRRQDKSFETKRYSKSDLIKWKAYNDKVRSLLEGKRCDLDIFTKSILEAAVYSLDSEPKQKKKNFIRPQTWEKIKERKPVRQRKISQTSIGKLLAWLEGTSKAVWSRDLTKTQMTATKGDYGNQCIVWEKSLFQIMSKWTIQMGSMSLWPKEFKQ